VVNENLAEQLALLKSYMSLHFFRSPTRHEPAVGSRLIPVDEAAPRWHAGSRLASAKCGEPPALGFFVVQDDDEGLVMTSP
jgi:hypothetical protein